jgi:antitoxin component YwqK of YwqJK toxin-antitoxin module|tara:strand:- start:4139 stop:7429 length:3291 start_codon:yes stop_codon:yes gene_type:complete
MKKILIAILLVAKIGFSQEKIPFIDYTEIEKLATESSNEGSYEKTLKLLNKISKNDSTYFAVLSSKSYYLFQLKKYNDVIKVANEGINISHNGSKVYFYINKGVALTNLKKYDEAIETYNLGIKTYPKNYLLWFNKGFLFETQGKLNEAISAYKKCITLNPLFRKPHLQMGNIFYKQERTTQALMCFNIYMLLEPDGSGAFTTLKSLNNIATAKNSNKRNLDLELLDADDSYEDIDLVLDSKMAVGKNYKIENKINIALTKQNHAMIEQLKSFDGNGGFWNTKYVALHKWIGENNYFDDFTHTLSYSIENPIFKKIIQSNTKKITAFLEAFKIKWSSIVADNDIVFNKKIQKVSFYYNDSYVDAIGKMNNNHEVGYWEYYNKDGLLIAIGNYDDSGKKIGKWTWYHGLNKIKETAFYKNGKLEGKNIMLHKNQKLYVDGNYKEDELDGAYKYYNDKGALVQHKFFKKGKLDSIYKSYFIVGEKILEFYIPYKNGLIDGETLEYYANGEVYSKANYVTGKINGLETKYHFNKQKYSEVHYTNGNLNGSYKSYYANGQLNEGGQSLDGSYDGAWKQYYSNGTLQIEYVYKKGKLTDLYRYYDTDGKLYYDFMYRKGEIISFKYYDKEGIIIKEGKKKGGEFYYEGFSPLGVKTSEGLYDISGGKKGKWKFYSNNGILTNEGNFIESKTTGNYYEYYNNGRKKSITPYKEDVIDGYFTGYHLNGKMNVQGWYKNGSEHGEWRYYYSDGTIQSINFFHKGKLHGNQESFGGNGGLISKTKMSFGEFISEKFFDKDGKAFEQINYQSKDNNYSLVSKHFNGKTKTNISYVNGVKHGIYTEFYFDGNKKVTGNFVNGELDGLWTWYHNTGELETKMNYLNGKLNGDYISYYKNGTIENKYSYENGVDIKTHYNFFEDGTKNITTQYYEGNLHGRKEFYDPSGKLQLIRFYNHGRIIGYSYLNKKGEEIPMKELINETGVISAFYENGNVSKKMEYKNGDLINSYKSYYYDGNPEDEIIYLDGEYNGVKKEYFLNGKIHEEMEYNYGIKHGKSTEYYKNGKVKEEKSYLNGQINGVVSSYNKRGKLKKATKYFNDKIISVETF